MPAFSGRGGQFIHRGGQVNNPLFIYKDLSYIRNIVAKISHYIKIEEISIVLIFLGNNIKINY